MELHDTCKDSHRELKTVVCSRLRDIRKSEWENEREKRAGAEESTRHPHFSPVPARLIYPSRLSESMEQTLKL